MKSIIFFGIAALSTSVMAAEVTCVANCKIIQNNCLQCENKTTTYSPVIATAANRGDAIEKLKVKCNTMRLPNSDAYISFITTEWDYNRSKQPASVDCND